MAIISNAALQAVLDKMARYGSEAAGDPELVADMTAGFATAGADVLSGETSANNLALYIMSTADEGVMADLLPAARDLDETNPTAPDGFLLSITALNAMITALNTHCKRYGGVAGLDTYLTLLNASTPTLRAHGLFKRYFRTVSAKNTFIPQDIPLAQVSVTGATTGTYLHLASISPTQYAGAKLVAKNVGALTATTALSITGKKLDLTNATLTVSISTLTSGTETNLSSVIREFIDVTAIAVTSGGTNGNVIRIVAKTDRDITAA